MSGIAILCAGQGGQHRGMFDLLGGVAEAGPVFAAAIPLLGVDPRRFVREAGEDALFANRAGQILCCTHALAGWAMLGLRSRRVVLAGYSVGELAAWGCAGLFGVEQTLALAAARAEAMDRAAPADAGLAAVVGLRRVVLDTLIGPHGLSVAIVNGADSFVVGGARAGLDAVLEAARMRGATGRMLRVSVPSHTALLEAAGAEFGAVLGRQGTHGPRDVRLLSGTDAGTVHDPAEGMRKLALQVWRTIEWSACLEACAEAGGSVFLELGPGSALARMAESVAGRPARSIEQFRTADGVRDWLARSLDTR